MPGHPRLRIFTALFFMFSLLAAGPANADALDDALRSGKISLLAAGPANADALDDALRSGKIGETQRGYIAPVTTPSPAITKTVNDINQRRRDKYRAIARQNNMTLGQIEAIVGKRIIERAAAGTYFKDAQGKWRQK